MNTNKEVSEGKKIEDYLHLYLGCDAIMTNPHGVTFDKEKLGQSSLMYASSFKPILRQLNSMTHTEINDIATIILGKDTTCGRIEWTDDKEYCLAYWKKEESIFPQYDFVEMGMHISNIGNAFRIDHVWNYIKGNSTSTSHEPLHNSHELTRYLLSKHFDLFNLIESGLAIEQKTS